MKLRGVSKFYGEKAALRGLDLEIEEGKITAVLGESGAGKTTLLRVLSGLLSYEGTVDGVPFKKPRRRENCSYLFQDGKLLPNLTVEGNLKFVLPKEEWGKIAEMIARVGLKGRERSYPHELSGGECQRVAVARAFLYPHDLLLMDEPFSSLDLARKRELTLLVTELWQERGSTVVFVTHDVREASLLAERALVLREGEIVCDLKIGEPYPRDFLAPPSEEVQLVRALLGGE